MCDLNIYLYSKPFVIGLISWIWTILVIYIIVVWCNIWNYQLCLYACYFSNVYLYWCINMYQNLADAKLKKNILLFCGLEYAEWDLLMWNMLFCGLRMWGLFRTALFGPQTAHVDRPELAFTVLWMEGLLELLLNKTDRMNSKLVRLVEAITYFP
jgi:hypothetical protein